MPALRVEALVCHPKVSDEGPVLQLAPVDLRVEAGQCVGISGVSGSGKTVLLRALADLDPSDGRVTLDDRERGEFSGPQWRRQVGYLPAESAWWDERIRSHFPGRRVQQLDALGLGLEVLRRTVSRLSTGERQRLALLRLLNHTPQVLLLDEPTGNLDPKNTRRVEALVLEYRRARNAAVLWVSHDPRQIQRVADQRLRIHQGTLASAPRRKPAKKKKNSDR